MSATVWVRHPITGGEAEVPRESLPQLRQSGWDLIPDDELAARAADAQAALSEEDPPAPAAAPDVLPDAAAAPDPAPDDRTDDTTTAPSRVRATSKKGTD